MDTIQPMDKPAPGDWPAACARENFSIVGRQLARQSAILDLMSDLGGAMTVPSDLLMLGGGNPALVPAVQRMWRQRMQELLAQGECLDRMLGNYEPPQGNPRFLRAFAALLERTYGWPVTEENVAVTAGTQTAAFFLFNVLGGRREGGRIGKILLPLSPEYIGYADQGLEPGLFVSCPPIITWPKGEAERVFKYVIDFEAVEANLRRGDIALVAVSRPTNPTGNVVTEAEVERLSALAAAYGVPLLIDGAYGVPFPGVVFAEARPHFAPHVINTFSLSKLGLPGTRTGMVVASPAIVSAVKAMTAIAGLANSNLGQHLVLPLVESGEILQVGPRWLRPFYLERSRAALAAVRKHLDAASVDWAVHASEGAFFLWLWLRGLCVGTRELYERLKRRGVLVVPGEFFFFGLSEPAPQQHECLRVSFAQTPAVVAEGIRRIAKEVDLVNRVER
jgi:valine--pyruvate aminotransferase